MITQAKLDNNKREYILLLKSINIDGYQDGIDNMISWLDDNQFFDLPASTKYHSNYPGGLCQHCLNVYHTLVKLVKQYEEDTGMSLDENSIKIVALCHDFGKVNFYRSTIRNKKDDATGKWYQVPGYEVIPADERRAIAGHEFTSFYNVSCFIPLNEDEICAIVNHHAGLDNAVVTQNYDLTGIFNTHPLAALLHMADFYSTYMLEDTKRD